MKNLVKIFAITASWLAVTAVADPAPSKINGIIPKGDGIFVYNVQQDLSTNSHGDITSNLVTNVLPQNGVNNDITYIFPSFFAIPANWFNNPEDEIYQCGTAADPNPNPAKTKYNYYAPALLQGVGVKNGQTDGCFGGQQITAAYKQGNPNRVVMPVIGVVGGILNLPTVPDNVAIPALTSLADAIANEINLDPNADGVMLDIESPSLGSVPSAVDRNVAFVTELATKLAKGKLLGIFDGETILKHIDASTHQNIFLAHALYDGVKVGLKAADNKMPLKLDTFVQQGLSASPPVNNFPIMYILPASNTWQLYTRASYYNVNLKFDYMTNNKITTPAVPPQFQAPTASTSEIGNLEPAAESCIDGKNTLSSAVRSFICDPSSVTASPASGDNTRGELYTCQPAGPSGTAAQTDFFARCKSFQNTDPSVDHDADFVNYFNAALYCHYQAKMQSKIATPDWKSKVIGVGLYAWKTPYSEDSDGSVLNDGYNIMSVIKHYYVGYYGELSLLGNGNPVFYPVTIENNVFASYLRWKSGNTTPPKGLTCPTY